jgi:hypothetical protein
MVGLVRLGLRLGAPDRRLHHSGPEQKRHADLAWIGP